MCQPRTTTCEAANLLGESAFVGGAERLRVEDVSDGSVRYALITYTVEESQTLGGEERDLALGADEVEWLTACLIDFLRAQRDPGEAVLAPVHVAGPQMSLFDGL